MPLRLTASTRMRSGGQLVAANLLGYAAAVVLGSLPLAVSVATSWRRIRPPNMLALSCLLLGVISTAAPFVLASDWGRYTYLLLTHLFTRFCLKAIERRHTESDLQEMRDVSTSLPTWRQHFFGLAVAGVLALYGDWSTSWAHLGPLEVSAPRGRHGGGYWTLRERVAGQLGLDNEVLRAREEVARANSAAV